MNYLLDTRDLQVEFTELDGQQVQLLRGVNLSIKHQEVAAVVGESGCGKSLTVKTVLGVLPPVLKVVAGQVIFDGNDLLKLTEKEYQKMRGKAFTLVPQHPLSSLNPLFTIEQQFFDLICYQGRLGLNPWTYLSTRHNRHRKREIREIMLEALNQVKLPHPQQILQQYPAQLSGGMCQRILIAMALVNDPKMVIADEPGTALDATIEAQINDLLLERVRDKGTTLLYITHDLGIAKQLSQWVFVMYCGRVVEHGPTAAVFGNPRHPYTIGLMNSVPKMSNESFTGIRGLVPDPKTVQSGCVFRWRCDEAGPECGEAEPADRPVGDTHYAACFRCGG